MQWRVGSVWFAGKYGERKRKLMIPNQDKLCSTKPDKPISPDKSISLSRWSFPIFEQTNTTEKIDRTTKKTVFRFFPVFSAALQGNRDWLNRVPPWEGFLRFCEQALRGIHTAPYDQRRRPCALGAAAKPRRGKTWERDGKSPRKCGKMRGKWNRTFLGLRLGAICRLFSFFTDGAFSSPSLSKSRNIGMEILSFHRDKYRRRAGDSWTCMTVVG